MLCDGMPATHAHLPSTEEEEGLQGGFKGAPKQHQKMASGGTSMAVAHSAASAVG
jgi:hypothetical protein